MACYLLFWSISDIHFRKSRLERTERLMKDLDWFEKQGCTIPEPSPPGKRYSTYLKKLAESSAPSFLCHYYNLYFAHATGGVGIGQKVVLTGFSFDPTGYLSGTVTTIRYSSIFSFHFRLESCVSSIVKCQMKKQQTKIKFPWYD